MARQSSALADAWYMFVIKLVTSSALCFSASAPGLELSGAVASETKLTGEMKRDALDLLHFNDHGLRVTHPYKERVLGFTFLGS